MEFIIPRSDVNTIWNLWVNIEDQKKSKISMRSVEKVILPAEIAGLIDKDGYLSAAKIKPKINFSEIKAGEDALEKVFSEIKGHKAEAIINGTLLLDSIYHTQIYDSLHFAFELKELLKENGFALLEEIRELSFESDNERKAECIDIIASLKVNEEGRKCAYSFATKFCNWVNREAFPIFDSYVAWLLHYYLHRDKTITRSMFTKTSFGSYIEFLSAFSHFKNYVVEHGAGFTCKQLDAFLWTTGKIIGNQSSITYKDPKKAKND